MTEMRPISVDTYHVPEPLKSYDDVWVVWCPKHGKTARAPWQEGHMYPAEWAEDKPVNPRTTYNQASATASLPPETLAERYPFPPDVEPAPVKATVLIPPKGTGNDLLFVDLDDVIVNGEITAEAWDILQRLGGYAEVSRSYDDPEKQESGAHAWVRASLPDGYGKFIADLEGHGQIELYDRGRMTGCTWRHIEETPLDAVPSAQETVESLIDKYGTEEEPPKADGGTTTSANNTAVNNDYRKKDNPYFQLDITDVADTGAFSTYRNDSRNPAHGNWQGPHPKHGGTSTPDRESTNFHVDPTDGCWHCFAHDSGGGALALIAVLEGETQCRYAQTVYSDGETLLQACLAARDNYAPELEGESPPYAALVYVAKEMGLDFADADVEILGDTAYNVANRVYKDMNY